MIRSVKLINNFFFQFILITLINFGLGGLLFFGLNSSGLFPADVELHGAPDDFIFYDSVMESFLAVVIIHFFRRYRWAEKPLVNYILLAVSLYVGKGFMVVISMAYSRFDYPFSSILWSNAGAFLFRMNMVWAGLFVYFRIEKEDRDEQTILLKELEISQLKALKTQADLEALQAKINPHFLYNSLNSIAGAIEEEPLKAKQMTFLLSKFFRFTTNIQSQMLWTIREELDLVSTYLSIEKIRFGERLDFSIAVEEDDLQSCLVPRFIIQPLVENAIKHGISQLPGKGIIGIMIKNEDPVITVRVYDNGHPFSEGLSQGYGLKSISEKLAWLGGQAAAMEIHQGDPADTNGNPSKYILIRLSKKYNDENHNS